MFNTKVTDGVYVNTALATYTFTDIIEYVRENIQLWEKSPLIWDLTKFPLSKQAEPSDIIRQQLSQSMDLAERRSGNRTAFVAPQDYDYGMFRMYCVFTEFLDYPVEMATFRTFEDAKAWIKGKMK